MFKRISWARKVTISVKECPKEPFEIEYVDRKISKIVRHKFNLLKHKELYLPGRPSRYFSPGDTATIPYRKKIFAIYMTKRRCLFYARILNSVSEECKASQEIH